MLIGINQYTFFCEKVTLLVEEEGAVGAVAWSSDFMVLKANSKFA